MKKLIILSFAFLVLIHMKANVITVSNGGNVIADYDDIQAAIDDATGSDTIYVYGSSVSYGDIAIDKLIYIFGTGHNPAVLNQNTSQLGNLTLDSGASGSVISGFYFENKNITAESGISNVLIENNFFYITTNTFSFLNTVNNDNWICKGNLFNITNTYWAGNFRLGSDDDNWLIANNIFTGYVQLDSLNATTIFSNNLYLRSRNDNGGYVNVFINSNSSLIQNNLFISTTGIDYGPQFASCNNCTYNNNLTWSSFGGTIDSIPGTDDIGSGNILKTNPAFVNFPTTEDFSFIYQYDVHLNDTSIAKNKGTDGKDIGPYGGSSPISLIGNSSLPRALQFDVKNPILQQGDSIIINIKATSAQ